MEYEYKYEPVAKHKLSKKDYIDLRHLNIDFPEFKIIGGEVNLSKITSIPKDLKLHSIL